MSYTLDHNIKFKSYDDDLTDSSITKTFRSFIPIESFTKEIIEKDIQIPKPNVGLRWGSKSEFEFNTDEQEKPNSGSMVVLPNRDLTERIEVFDISPVWREFIVYRLWDEKEEHFIDVAYTISMLIPLDQLSLQYVSGFTWISGHAEPVMKTRSVQTYLKLNMAVPNNLVRAFEQFRSTEGQWPTEPLI